MGSPVTSWDLQYAYGGSQSLSQGWSGTWAQSGSSVTVRSAGWNGALATGGSAQIGANFAYRGTNTAPTAFTLNGTACTGSATAPAAPPASTAPSASTAPPASAGSAPQLQVDGNMLVNAQGQQVVLHGVDRSGTEFACVQNFGIFDGPGDQASITAMKSFGVNAVRVPLNEACWNGESS